ARADHDRTVDRQVVERQAHRHRRVVLGRLLLGPAQPARPGQCRSLGHPGKVLAEAESPLAGKRFLAPLLLGLRHEPTAIGSAAVRTRSITSAIASSMFPFSTIGTSCLRARSRM